MHDYTVLAVSRSGAEHAVCLADAAGGFHVARATAGVPAVGAKLLGVEPKLGFGLLLGAPIDEVFRVIFEQVHCSYEEAHHSLFGGLQP
jgi:hypothetical protein